MQITQDYRRTINASCTAGEAFEKVGNIADWWYLNVVGETHALGGEFTIQFAEDIFVSFKITEAVSGQRIAWQVEDCNLSWLTNKTEWNGTRVIFDIATNSGETTVTMTHEGLQPQKECFEDCQAGWNRFFGESLAHYLNTGQGMPEGMKA